jgi:hypothetical protein
MSVRSNTMLSCSEICKIVEITGEIPLMQQKIQIVAEEEAWDKSPPPETSTLEQVTEVSG